MQIKHDGDGKIYNDGKFLFEVMIQDGDEVAKRINLLLEAVERSDNTTKFEIEQAVMCSYIDKFGADGKQGEFADSVLAQLPNIC